MAVLTHRQVLGWKMTTWVRVRFNETDYVAVFDLPFDLARFRWRGRSTGPSSDVCIAHIPSPSLSAETLYQGALQVRLTVDAPPSWAALVRFRFRTSGRLTAWTQLQERPLELRSKRLHHVGEPDGLHPGKSYVFSAQLLSSTRRSQWSAETLPVFFKIPLVTVPGGTELAVRAKDPTSVSFSWPGMSPTALEFRLDVFRKLPDGLQHRTSVLAEGVEGKATFEADLAPFLLLG